MQDVCHWVELQPCPAFWRNLFSQPLLSQIENIWIYKWMIICKWYDFSICPFTRCFYLPSYLLTTSWRVAAHRKYSCFKRSSFPSKTLSFGYKTREIFSARLRSKTAWMYAPLLTKIQKARLNGLFLP